MAERESTFLTVADAARRASVSSKTIYREIRRGELRAMRIRSRYRITPEDFRCWIESCRMEDDDNASPRSAPARAPKVADGPGTLARLRSIEAGAP
jgi:excisionase family DNA binding protein